MKYNLSPNERTLLGQVHDVPFIEAARQSDLVRGILASLESKGLLGPSCLKRGALESTEAGAKLLGYA